MKTNEDLVGRYAYLPGGQKVRIEGVGNGLATLRRVGGTYHGRRAVCPVIRLELMQANPEPSQRDKKTQNRLITRQVN